MWMPLLALTALALMPAAYGQEEICTISSEPVLDLVFVIDSSGSINAVGSACNIDANILAVMPALMIPDSCKAKEENYEYMKTFIKDIVKDLTIGPDNVRVGLVLFSSAVQHLFYLNTYTTKAEIMTAIDNMPYLGFSTSTRLALEEAHHEQLENKEHGDREMVPDLVIVLTDGESNFDNGDTQVSDIVEVLRISEHMHEDGVNMIAVGVTSAVNMDEIKGISSPDHVENKNWFFIEDFSGLPDMVPNIMKETCEVIPPEPPTPTEKPADICIPKTKVYGTNLRFTLTDGNNFATVADREACLDLCDQYDLCASIEFNIGFSKCQINKRLIGDDVTGIHARWEYCPRRTPMPNQEN